MLRNLDAVVVHFDYPRFSWLWFCLLQVVNYVFNPNYLLTYLMIILFLVISSYSEFWANNITPFFKKYFMGE